MSEQPTKQPSIVIAWFIEFYQRMSLESPRFFQVLQAIGMWASIIAGIPVAIEEIESIADIQIPFPEVVDLWIAKIVFWCGLIVKIISKLPVKQPPMEDGEKVTEQEKKVALPFTDKSKETDGSTSRKKQQAKVKTIEGRDNG